MSHIGITLSANTAVYTQRLREAKTETDRNLILMERRVDQFASSMAKDFSTVNGAINSITNGIRNLKFGGYIAGAGAVTAASIGIINSLNQVGIAARDNAVLITNGARQAKMSVEEFIDTTVTLGAVGIQMEQFGDISKDVFDKMGEYTTTGSGAFQDFFDVVGSNTNVTIAQLQRMSSIDVFRTMYDEMVKAGASSQQITWVMESMGNEASRLAPLLRDGGKEYDRLQAKMKRNKLHLLGSTSEEISALDASLKAASHNFEVYMSERFVNLTKMFNDFSHSVSNWFNDEGEHFQVKNTVEAVADGSFSLSSITNAKEMQAHIDRLTKGLTSEQKNWESKNKYGSGEFAAVNNNSFNEEEYRAQQRKEWAIKDAIRLAKDELARLEAEEAAAGAYNGVGGESTESRLKETETLINQKLKLEEDALARQKELLNKEREYRYKASMEMSADRKAELEEVASNYGKAAKIQQENARLHAADAKKAEATKYEIEQESRTRRLEAAAKYSIDEATKAAAARDLALHELKLDTKKGEVEVAESNIRKAAIEHEYKEALQDINKKKLAETREAEDQRYNAALTFAVDGNAKLNAQYAIDLLNLNRALEDKKISQSLYDANIKQLAITKAADEKAIEFKKQNDKLEIQRTFATTSSAEREASLEQELLQIEEYRGQEGITDEMILNKKADLRREARQAQLDEDLAFMESDAERNLIKAEADLEMLRMQLENEDVTKDEFRVQEIEKEKALADAKRAVQYEHLGMMADVMAGVSGLAKEGSTAQKVLFAAEKAATIAQMTIKMEETAAAAKLAAMKGLSGPAAVAAGEAAAMKERIMGGASIAKVVATSIGQFHNGGEVDQTGSYILKAGERVVAPDTNKELKSFLKEGNSSNTGANINAPLNIQGDTTISEARLTAMMAKQRDSIAKMVRLAERENPSLR